ncbi:hypothetical protein, partial [Solibacillus isronensis]|uniref:hypothetical protein n=1 Tax=Solibacillus isronensis TaxID=412383 RepID=UPI0039A1C0D6
TEVKLFSADGSWGLPPVRVGRRFAHVKPTEKSVGFLFCLKTIITYYFNADSNNYTLVKGSG